MARILIALLASALGTTPPQALVMGTDRHDRMTVDVRINDNGPFPFVVDTGAERTVISSKLAGVLKLPDAGPAELHSLEGKGIVPTYAIDRLSIGDGVVAAVRAPALMRSDIGAAGILGIDTLQNQRVVLDFRGGRMSIHPASRDADPGGGDEIVVRARSRFGRLIIADAEADGQKINVIIDTGAEVTIGNQALAARLARRARGFDSRPLDLLTVSGGHIIASRARLSEVRIGGVHMREMPVAIADAHIFNLLGLNKRPALLLGMDVLKSFDRVSVDFANRRVRFLTPDA